MWGVNCFKSVISVTTITPYILNRCFFRFESAMEFHCDRYTENTDKITSVFARNSLMNDLE